MMGKIASLLRRRVVGPVMEQLRQGITPSRLALSLAIGVVLSSMPLLGFTGAICVAVAFAFRLNQPAILAANYAATPLQVVLFVPFFRAGSWLFRAPSAALSFTQLRAELDAGFLKAMAKYWDANLRAMAVFAIVAPVAVAVLYAILFPVLSRLSIRRPEPIEGERSAAPAEPAK
jgi:uncharacterized protein (DUF2062 family)